MKWTENESSMLHNIHTQSSPKRDNETNENEKYKDCEENKKKTKLSTKRVVIRYDSKIYRWWDHQIVTHTIIYYFVMRSSSIYFSFSTFFFL